MNQDEMKQLAIKCGAETDSRLWLHFQPEHLEAYTKAVEEKTLIDAANKFDGTTGYWL